VSSFQDYIIIPGQLWLDSIADSNGTVWQFVAISFGSGYSAESQVTGKDSAGDIQVEMTPYVPQSKGENQVFLKIPTGYSVTLKVSL
jgi:hypothetical protein